MAEAPLNVLLDQNVPLAVADWLRTQRPEWTVDHVNELGLQGKPDEYLYRWAQETGAIIIAFDEDSVTHDYMRSVGMRESFASEYGRRR
jgi:predicted nuclease of predicted toxin-antitoxin system